MSVEDLVITDELIDRFFQYVRPGPDGHQLWTGPTFPTNLRASPAFPISRFTVVSARRFAYHVFVTKLSGKRRVYPLCSERLCVNPEHATITNNETCRKGHEKVLNQSTKKMFCLTCTTERRKRRRDSWEQQAQDYIGSDLNKFRLE